MVQTENSDTGGESSRQDGSSHQTESSAVLDRRIPFVLRVAVIWTSKDELPSAEDGQLRYWRRAPLTGAVLGTSGGRDVTFSDLEVQ